MLDLLSYRITIFLGLSSIAPSSNPYAILPTYALIVCDNP